MFLRAYFKKIKTPLAGVIGMIFEFYDYSLFGFFIPIFSRVFFPSENIETSIFYSLSVFAAGFIMRPFGSIVWGYIGDLYGRQCVLVNSILLMSISTVVMGILPTYAQAGILSPLLLILCRLVQGFSMGGEFVTSFVFTLEHTKKDKKGWIGSLVNSGQKIGFMLGTLAYYFVVQTENPEWNWRYAFFLGGLLGLVGLFVRIFLEESPEYKSIQHPIVIRTHPLREAYEISTRNIFTLSGLTVCCTGLTYTAFIYSNIFFNEKFAWASKDIAQCSLYGHIVCIMTMLITGYLSDKINGKSLMIGSLCFGLFAIFPVYSILFYNNDINSLFLFYIFIGIVVGGCTGPWCALIDSSFPITHKLSGISLGFAIPQALVGGLTPITLKTLLSYSSDLFIPIYYLAICLAIGIISLFFMRPLKVTQTEEQSQDY